ncbi:serine/threonine-protein kinase ATR-like isoform X2 [Tachypleus tridentatus]|uniref:serine/threonine-protein kinase ATR-like isoform X2 n=1 Tax=Tachypleus tridentatus TaxID=6853 RepID=UPI003FD55058
MYLELSIKNNQESSRLQLPFLQKLYILLDEPDGVAGVAASRQEDPTLHDLILGHEATGSLLPKKIHSQSNETPTRGSL